jgi:hypothetical protein
MQKTEMSFNCKAWVQNNKEANISDISLNSTKALNVTALCETKSENNESLQ